MVSIYGMTQQARCQKSGKQQSDLERPLESMEQLIVHNCSPGYLVRRRTVKSYIIQILWIEYTANQNCTAQKRISYSFPPPIKETDKGWVREMVCRWPDLNKDA